MKSIRICFFLGLFGVTVGSACVHTKAGTHVEVIEMNGRQGYVSGAAGVGKSKTASCAMAVRRAAKAVAHRFAQEQSGLGDELAEELEIEDGAALLYEYVNRVIVSAPVKGLSYDPMDHSCMAVVRWQPPVFLKKAVLRYAEGLVEAEAPSASPAIPVGPSGAEQVEVNTERSVTVKETVTLKKHSCDDQEGAALRASAVLAEKEALWGKCLRKTKGDEEVCFRYGEYVKQEKVKMEAAQGALKRCREILTQ